MNTQGEKNGQANYEIRVASHLGDYWSARFEGLTITHTAEGETVLSGVLDQSALHGVLAKIRGLGLNLISVNQVEDAESNW